MVCITCFGLAPGDIVSRADVLNLAKIWRGKSKVTCIVYYNVVVCRGGRVLTCVASTDFYFRLRCHKSGTPIDHKGFQGGQVSGKSGNVKLVREQSEKRF